MATKSQILKEDITFNLKVLNELKKIRIIEPFE